MDSLHPARHQSRPGPAVVTGAGRGIGAAIARRLAAEGAAVALLDADQGVVEAAAEALRKQGATALAIHCDVRDRAAVADAARRVERELGRPTVLVDNAGLVRVGPLEEHDPADWEAVRAVNLDGYFNCMQAFGRQMLDHGGAIVNVASTAALATTPNSGAYSATKAGVVALTRQAALEWGPRGVRVNAVCPGLVEVPMGGSPLQRTQAQIDLIPLRRLTTAEDVAGVVAFLAGDLATNLTGVALPVDGGLSGAIMSAVQSAAG